MKKFLKSFYVHLHTYFYAGIVFAFLLIGYFFEIFFYIGVFALFTLIAVFIFDFMAIYFTSSLKIQAIRHTPDKLSNGDENLIGIEIVNKYKFPVRIEIIDEIPFQFQIRDFLLKAKLKSEEKILKHYSLRPVQRGEYYFGNLNVFVSTPISIISCRLQFDSDKTVPVYPSFLSLRKYELLAVSNRLTEAGIKKIRKISNNNEFEQIREYVQGDDFRTLNWKATARKSRFMVNQYQDEKSQQVYSIIDMGRTMKMPFREMSLLDYAINTSLVISNTAIIKHDKAGIITFSQNIDTFLPAERKSDQMSKILNVLYKQTTNFRESDFEILYATVKRKIAQRSLLLIYTNFEGYVSLQRQMAYFKRLAKNHLLTVIFFENTEIEKILHENAGNIEDVYKKTMAERYFYEKRLIKKELTKNGIHAVLTKPENLTVDTINKYLEFKARGLL